MGGRVMGERGGKKRTWIGGKLDCTKPGASTPYKRWSRCTIEKVGGSVYAET